MFFHSFIAGVFTSNTMLLYGNMMYHLKYDAKYLAALALSLVPSEMDGE